MKLELIENEDETTTVYITYEDGTKSELNDCIEPEDVSFGRDLAPFLTEIERAHQKGFEAGYKEAEHNMEENQ